MRNTIRILLSVLLIYTVQVGCKTTSTDPTADALKATKKAGYTVENLVADVEEYDPELIDPELVNAWGLAFGATGLPWIANEGTGTSTFYRLDSTVTKVGSVKILSSTGEAAPVIGIVFNPTNGFRIDTSKSFFIFATGAGEIAAWKPGQSVASIIKPESEMNGYTGLALSGTILYAANFKLGRVDMYDSSWNYIGWFTDPMVPSDYAPFNVQNIGGQIYVMFAKRDGDEEATGAGLGYVSRFTQQGHLDRQLIAQGNLNAPWGIVKATGNFGEFSGQLLIGNFGDGHINVYSESGTFKGQLKDTSGNPIMIEGLWALQFGNTGDDVNDLYFTAGPDDETHGVFGEIEAVK
jgi:uncharacterized protein (TIGR03118 family)